MITICLKNIILKFFQKIIIKFLVEKGDHEELIEKLRLLLEDKDLAKKMGNEGRKFIEETFNWELITKNFIKIAESYLK